LSSDDNGQDLTNYNFSTDGFRTANTTANEVYLATGGTPENAVAENRSFCWGRFLENVISQKMIFRKIFLGSLTESFAKAKNKNERHLSLLWGIIFQSCTCVDTIFTGLRFETRRESPPRSQAFTWVGNFIPRLVSLYQIS
jgi:hypothetical protein